MSIFDFQVVSDRFALRRSGMGSRRAVQGWIGCVILLHLAIIEGWSGEPSLGLRPETLTVGFTKCAFLHMNRSDVDASYRVLAETLGRKRGYQIHSSSGEFDEPAELEAALRAGTIRLAAVDSWSYLAMDKQLVTPALVSSEHNRVGRTYLLLAREDSGFRTIADLKNKEIMELATANNSLGPNWLETLLLTNRLGPSGAFFGRVETVSKPSAAVLPVFFGKKQACVVDTTGFEVMKELNPQVGKTLHVIASSEPLTSVVICLRSGEWASEQFRRDLIQVLVECHTDPAGQQLLSLFKTDQLIPFQESHLDAVRELRSHYDQFHQEVAARH